MRRIRRLGVLGLVVLGALIAGAPAPAAAPVLNPVVEAQNYAKTLERQAIYDTPQGQLLLRTVSNDNGLSALTAQLADPEREFVSDLCWNGNDGCAGEYRLYDWQRKGYGIVRPVLFTARDGATLSGHVWATRSGPRRRPGIVITNGSVQADEQMYWYAAQALAKAGYVVLTFDPQGQGRSDTFGEGADRAEGFPAQTDGRPFFDGTEDALNFFFSTPTHPYVPESSCSTGTSHAAKQARRVRAGLDSGYNPFWKLFDGRVGLAGHSYGAAGVSYIGQWDHRVKAIVAWDNLSSPKPGTNSGSFPPGEAGCPAHPADRRDATQTGHTPALGMSADYFLPPTPNLTYPDQSPCPAAEAAYERDGTAPSLLEGTNCKSFASDLYSKHGIDTGEIVIRGGSHLDFSFIPNPAFGATLRGADMIAWYTTAWFDKYVKGQRSADRRLLTTRWQSDLAEAAVDPRHDGNMFSFYHPSRLDFRRFDGSRVDCEDLRAGCPALSAHDGYRGRYSYLALATSKDGTARPGTPAGRPIWGSAATRRAPAACAAKGRAVVRLRAPRGMRIERVVARSLGRVVGRASGGDVALRLPRRTSSVRFAVTLRGHGRTSHVTLTRRYRRCG